MGEEELKRLHSQYRLELSDYIEKCLRKLPQYMPGFQFETVVSDRGWGGKVSRDDFSGGLRINADRLLTLAEARGRFAKALRLALNGKVGLGDTATEKLRLLLAPYRNGPCPVRVRYRNTQAECELPLGESWRVRLEDDLLSGLQQWLEAENVEVVYQ